MSRQALEKFDDQVEKKKPSVAEKVATHKLESEKNKRSPSPKKVTKVLSGNSFEMSESDQSRRQVTKLKSNESIGSDKVIKQSSMRNLIKEEPKKVIKDLP